MLPRPSPFRDDRPSRSLSVARPVGRRARHDGATAACHRTPPPSTSTAAPARTATPTTSVAARCSSRMTPPSSPSACCPDEPSIEDFDGQTMLWQTVTDGTRRSACTSSRSRVRRAAHWRVLRDGAQSPCTGAPCASPPSRAPRACSSWWCTSPRPRWRCPPPVSPAAASTASPSGSPRTRRATTTAADAPRDQMPDVGAPPMAWPSRCRPDIDPTASGHVRLRRPHSPPHGRWPGARRGGLPGHPLRRQPLRRRAGRRGRRGPGALLPART